MTPEEPDYVEEELEVVDGLPVLASEPAHSPLSVTVADAPGGLVPRRQAAALAATTFMAGAATVALAQRRRTAKVVGPRKKRSSPAHGEVAGTSSFLVDVHVLRRD